MEKRIDELINSLKQVSPEINENFGQPFVQMVSGEGYVSIEDVRELLKKVLENENIN